MTYRKFYSGRLDMRILDRIDAEYEKKRKILTDEIDRGAWTQK